jgi:Tol biopolymer transport system component
VASDGRIAYAAITPAAGGGATSRIEVLGAGGEVSVVTQGPGDATPSWSPDGTRIAFSGPHARDGGVFDADLWWTAATGGQVHIALDAPGTDEAGPVWSRDGRWLFATSLVRKPDTGEALLSSVVHVDLTASKPQVRMLVDRAGAVARLAPALAPVTLDAAALTANPDYRTELTRILRRAADRHQRDAAGAAGEP